MDGFTPSLPDEYSSQGMKKGREGQKTPSLGKLSTSSKQSKVVTSHHATTNTTTTNRNNHGIVCQDSDDDEDDQLLDIDVVVVLFMTNKRLSTRVQNKELKYKDLTLEEWRMMASLHSTSHPSKNTLIFGKRTSSGKNTTKENSLLLKDGTTCTSHSKSSWGDDGVKHIENPNLSWPFDSDPTLSTQKNDEKKKSKGTIDIDTDNQEGNCKEPPELLPQIRAMADATAATSSSSTKNNPIKNIPALHVDYLTLTMTMKTLI